MNNTPNTLEAELAQRLTELRAEHLHRELRRIDSPQQTRLQIDGRMVLNFSSNDYLGLANEPRLKEAAIRAVERFGAGSGASRLVCGSLAPHHQLEETLADFKGAPAALTFATGYAATTGTLTALLGKDDIVILDKLVHASIVDGARASGARLRVFAHNDLNDLESKLTWAQTHSRPSGRILVITETVFSMDGDCAPLKEIVELKERFGAWLMIDEAHATGLYGKNGRGLADEAGVAGRIEIQMGTLGKALGSSGGYVCGSRALIDYLINRARTFVFSTAPVPAAAAAALAGIEFVQSADGAARRAVLWKRVRQLTSALGQPARSAIVPRVIGEETDAMRVSAALLEQNLFVPAIRFPTVARGSARLRITLSAAHEPADIDVLTAALRSATPAHAPA